MKGTLLVEGTLHIFLIEAPHLFAIDIVTLH